MGIKDVFRTDLILVHPPSVYDFRKSTILTGPIADAVPSTDEFEMYPAGLTSIAAYLARNQYNVRIINLAYRMLKDNSYDARKRLKGLRAPVFGIDLHWLPHAHGALTVAELLKKLHPESLILLGGLSSTYYHRELIEEPAVDLILRGDSTEEPVRQLLASLRENKPLDSVENLTWKRPNGDIVINPLTFVPRHLDYIDIPDYAYAIKEVFKYWSLRDLVPYLRWLQHPTAMLLNSRGCTLNCSTCGGSRSAYEMICNRSWPAFRSPEKMIYDAKSIASFTRSPIVVIHDMRVGGLPRAKRFFSLLKMAGIKNEFVFELFYPAGNEYFRMVRDSVLRYSLQLTIETPNEELRKFGGLKFPVPNSRIEDTISSALSNDCRKLDIFFMVGIPHQTYDDAMATLSYCEELTKKFHADPRLGFFISPMGPFLDPGCGAFEDPKYGYRHFYKTLQEHKQALLEPTWETILSYETDSMTRNQMLKASYDVAKGLNNLKLKYGLIDKGTYNEVMKHMEAAKQAIDAMTRAFSLPEPQRDEAIEKIREQVQKANVDSLFSKNELEWQGASGLRFSFRLFRILTSGFAQELVHSLYRFQGKYDTDVYTGKEDRDSLASVRISDAHPSSRATS
jgi:B12-binding domain/radical SAM domain protein